MISTRAIGLVNSVTCVSIFIIYLPCLAVIGTDPELKTSCYRVLLMFHLGASDLLYTAVQLLFGLFTATGYTHLVPPGTAINSFFASIAVVAFMTSIMFLCLLGLNRWLVIANKNIIHRLFSNTGTTVLIVLGWAYGSLCCVGLHLASVDPYYRPSLQIVYYSGNSTNSALAKALTYVANNFMLCTTALLYLLAFVGARSQRKAVGPLSNKEFELQQSLLVTENRLAKQGAVIFFYTFMTNQYWHGARILIDVGFKHVLALGNWLGIFNAAVNPLIYLGMNGTIRAKVKLMFGLSHGQ